MRLLALLPGVLLLTGCAQPAPTQGPSPVPPGPAGGASAQAGAALRVEGTVRESCGAVGGCAYFAELKGSGTSGRGEFSLGGQAGAMTVGKGLPAALPAGSYTLTLTSWLVSDAIVNNVRQLLGKDASCVADFEVAPGQPAVTVLATFDIGACSADVNNSP